jgi:23S rRNA pseudouridine2604 synthase
LTDDEINQLNKLIEPSSKTEEASLPKKESINVPSRVIRNTNNPKPNIRIKNNKNSQDENERK